jgi:hypothetical protein
MNGMSFGNLLDTIRECDDGLRQVVEKLPAAFADYTRESQGGTNLGFTVAAEEIIRLRTTVDTITRQFLHQSSSPDFKERVESSMSRGNWLYLEL